MTTLASDAFEKAMLSFREAIASEIIVVTSVIQEDTLYKFTATNAGYDLSRYRADRPGESRGYCVIVDIRPNMTNAQCYDMADDLICQVLELEAQ